MAQRRRPLRGGDRRVPRRDRGEAVASLRPSCATCTPAWPIAWRGAGATAEAEREFRAELAEVPSSTEGRVGLATLYRSQGRDAEARAVLGGLVAAQPQPTADTYWTVVHAFTVLGDTAGAREWAAKAHTAFPADPRFR